MPSGMLSFSAISAAIFGGAFRRDLASLKQGRAASPILGSGGVSSMADISDAERPMHSAMLLDN